MKKTLFLLGILIPLSFTGFSQIGGTTVGTPDSRVGIKGALNLSNWYNEELDDKNVKVGFTAGLFYRGYVSDVFSIQPEINYTQKGSTFTYDNFFADGEVRGYLDYVEVPVIFNFHLTENFHLGAGPYIATLVSARAKAVDDDGPFDGEEEFDRDNFTTFDYGLSADAGLDFVNLTVGARYNLGLADIDWETGFGDTNLGKNSLFQIYLGFMF
ncbi:PorT family protein [Marivirga sp. S37H4]|uniref:PorT family protein n=1 Tax=Marivirga aurantiaca TaxID=2802615 RepID=A0A935C836_9BACT|nr:porin family protein [Marivirga aurantiaca]MBK6265285.1 PorT family protein [Marivirga aurantiaca]